jgi:hypothetical protein
MGNALSNTIKKLMNSGASVISIIFAVITICAIAFGLECLIVWFCMFLWNSCLVAAIPAISTVGFWQMYGLHLLFHVLFKTTVNTVGKTEE